MNFKKYITNIALVVGIAIILNLVSDQMFFRLDFTENGQYTLSDATIDILENLDQPVTIKAYFSKNLPPNITSVRRNFKDLLIEYASHSNGKIKYQIYDPSEDEDIEKEAMQEGVQPVLVNIREKDQIKQQKAYLGAVIKIGEQKEVIPFMQPGSPMEYALSSAIKKISVTQKPVVGIVQGQGEPELSELQQVKAELEVLYDVRTVNLDNSTPIAKDIKTLAIVRPTDTLTSGELNVLDNFVKRGGNIFIAMQRVNGDLKTLYATSQTTMLEQWLQNKGINVEPALVVDAKCGTVGVQQQQGMFRYMSQVQFPYIPIISKFADNPAVKGLESVIMPFTSPVSFSGDSSIKYIPLLYTSDKSDKINAPFMFQVNKQWTQNDLTKSNIVVGAAFEGKFFADTISRMIVLGNGSFAIGNKNSRQQIQPDNVSLFVNSIDWLTDDTGLINLRTKAITSRPLDELEDSTKTMLKYLNFLLPIILIIIYGIFRNQRNKSIRLKRKEESYV